MLIDTRGTATGNDDKRDRSSMDHPNMRPDGTPGRIGLSEMCRAEDHEHRYYCTLPTGHSSEVLHETRGADAHRELLHRWA